MLGNSLLPLRTELLSGLRKASDPLKARLYQGHVLLYVSRTHLAQHFFLLADCVLTFVCISGYMLDTTNRPNKYADV